METFDNMEFSVMIEAVSTEGGYQRSILPDRFVSGSHAQPTAIVDAGLGATFGLEKPVRDILVPATAVY